MKKLILGLTLCATPTWAANLCTTITAAQDAQLVDAATREGRTVQQLVDTTISSMVSNKYNSAVNAAVGTALANKWPTLTGTQKTNICTQLTVSPCPP